MNIILNNVSTSSHMTIEVFNNYNFIGENDDKGDQTEVRWYGRVMLDLCNPMEY